jgi:hypothetical protein
LLETRFSAALETGFSALETRFSAALRVSYSSPSDGSAMRRQVGRREEKTMTGRCLFFTLLSVSGAAAIPAAHGLFGGGAKGIHAWMHGSMHAAPGEGVPSADQIRAHVDLALDALGLEPATRAQAKAILEPNLVKVIALHEKLASGEMKPEDAMAEHEQIVTAAKSDLESVLTQKQIEQFVDTLHPQEASAHGK